MAATLPQPSRPSLNPPTVALPPLPLSMSRKSLPTPSNIPNPSRLPSASYRPSKLAFRAPSISALPTAAPVPQHANSTSNVPTLTSTSITAERGLSPTGRILRKTISIAAFPQPPKGATRPTSILLRPSSGSTIPKLTTAATTAATTAVGTRGSGDSKGSLRQSSPGSMIPQLAIAVGRRGSSDLNIPSRPSSSGSMIPKLATAVGRKGSSDSNVPSRPSSSGSLIPKLATAVGRRGSSDSNNSSRPSSSGSMIPKPTTAIGRRGSSDSNNSSRPSSSGSMIPKPTTAISRRGSSDLHSPAIPRSTVRVKRPKISHKKMSPTFYGGNIPTLLNGSGDGRCISGGGCADGLLSLPSPPQSRGSSGQGSYSTIATTFEDVDDGGPKGRDEADDSRSDSDCQAKTKEGKGNVIVSVRVRPNAAHASSGRTESEWMVDGRKAVVAFRGREGGEYHYDNVFETNAENYKVYDASAKRLVRRVMEGYHGTVFAYGMTGTGKTFSMQGTSTSLGVIPLAITDIFSYIRETPRREFLLRVSYLEIYNEKIYDLLSPPTVEGIGAPGSSQQEEIKLREDSKRGVYAAPLKEEIVQSPTQLLRVISRGDQVRKTSSTKYNARSSRSHAVVQIVVESRERAAGAGSMQENKRAAIGPGGVRISTLSLIDLAGSERAAESKERRTEGSHINKSLLTLGTVIGRLSGEKAKDSSRNPSNKDGKHLPYRDSKLTRLLQPALSGNSLVSILCTIQVGSSGSVASANGHVGETLNTLKFAARAKNNIVSHAKKAEEALGGPGDAGSRALLELYRTEIQSLRGQLEGQAKILSEKEGKQLEQEEKRMEQETQQRHEEQMLEMHLARTALKERINHLNRLVLSSRSTGVNSSRNFSSMSVDPRHSVTIDQDVGPESVRSSASHSTLAAAPAPLFDRIASDTTVANQSQDHHSPNSSFGIASEESDSTGGYGDGTASLSAQIRALRADVAEKDRYISTLEKRLLQARRTSVSLSQKALDAVSAGEECTVASLLAAKDDEIAELRSSLEERDSLVSALQDCVNLEEF
ncbi:MAG: hypothetical protein M1830_001659 [Pleopsidium flavum]|nr:MAG: hypothetical protein M1830_001659 [Pleopsidium flavum]